MAINNEKKLNALNENELESVSGGVADWRNDQAKAINNNNEGVMKIKNSAVQNSKKEKNKSGSIFD